MTLQLIEIVLFHPIRFAAGLTAAICCCFAVAVWACIPSRTKT